MKKYQSLLFLAAFFIASAVHAADENRFEQTFFPSFKSVKSFARIAVSLEGSAKNLGLDQSELTDYLRLRFKNAFTNVEFKPEDPLELCKDRKKLEEAGYIEVKVWTEGHDFPIALHVQINSGNHLNTDEYKSATLSSESKSTLRASVKESINTLVDSLAISFFKARDEL